MNKYIPWCCMDMISYPIWMPYTWPPLTWIVHRHRSPIFSYTVKKTKWIYEFVRVCSVHKHNAMVFCFELRTTHVKYAMASRNIRKMISSNGKKFHVTGLLWGDSPHKDQWRRALLFYLISARTYGWAINRDASDLRRHRAHYDVTVMEWKVGSGNKMQALMPLFSSVQMASNPAKIDLYNLLVYSTPRPR